MKTVKTTLALAVLACVLLGATAAFGSSATPTAGTIHVFAVQQGLSRNSAIVITGAIGDYGKTFSIDKNGTTDPNGKYLKVVLQDGTFEANTVALGKKLGQARPTIYGTTCSGQFVGRSPVALFNGTGRYAGITGSVNMTVTGAYVLPRYKSGEKMGQCNTNAEPIGVYTSNTGSGKVRFSYGSHPPSRESARGN
jgi:hypothetical protein